MTEKTGNTRPRNAIATRQDILDSARTLFSREGYGRVGLRQIALEAGVTAGLVNRYFGNKENLFITVLESVLDPDDVVHATGEFGGWVRSWLEMKCPHEKSDSAFDPLMIVLRSASQAEVAGMLRDLIERRLAGPIAERLVGSESTERAGLVLASLAGLNFMKGVLNDPGLDAVNSADIATLLAPVFGDLLNQGASPPPNGEMD